jgi:hypothetical protein
VCENFRNIGGVRMGPRVFNIQKKKLIVLAKMV